MSVWGRRLVLTRGGPGLTLRGDPVIHCLKPRHRRVLTLRGLLFGGLNDKVHFWLGTLRAEIL